MNARNVLLLANLALLALLAYTVKGMVFAPETPRPAPVVKQQTVPAVVAAASDKPRPAADYGIIVERNIFGAAEAPKETPGERTRAVPPPPKPLELKLLGTIAGDADIARAIIQDSLAKTQASFKIGDVVQGATVSQILRNKVILLSAGREEVLELSVEPGEPAAVPVPAVAASALAQAGDPAAAIKVLSPTRREIDKAAFIAKAGGADGLLGAAKLEPCVVDGQMMGVRVTGIENAALAEAAGLENGDIVKAVNGQDLTSMQKAFQVLRKARGQPSIDIQLLRGTEERALAFGMK